VLVTALATTILAISIANTGVGATNSYNAVFSDVTGLTAGSDVDIAGARVGQVNSISIVNRDQALVGFSVQTDHPLPASVTATIHYLNLIGQRYIELDQGTGPVDQMLPSGGTIPLTQTTPALDLTALFNGFQPLFQAFSPGVVNQLSSEIVQALQGEGSAMNSLLANVGQLTTTLAGKQKVIDSVIGNLNSLLGTINSRGTELGTTVATLQQLVSGLAAERQPIGNAISAMASLTNATAGLLQGIRPPLKANISALNDLANNLAAGTPAINSALANLPSKMTDIARLASYGSWLNFFLCDATVTGVSQQDYPGNTIGHPTGVHSKAPRCTG
jgi:phospholipid/cholesterol/gamma-HCH transport system substrate-binding protein